MRPAERSVFSIVVLFMVLALGACGSGVAEAPVPAPSTAPASDGDASTVDETAGVPSAGPAVVQPGAPGQPSRTVSATALSAVGDVGYSAHDVRFMQGMIPHHAQALDMTALVKDRTEDPGFRLLTLRMEISQRDEIQLMSRWLETRGESVPTPGAHVGHDRPMMPGMLTQAQMRQLEAASGVEFEKLFLELMIQHHEGAIQMVRLLFASQGGGQESEIFQFATDVDVDQRMEIKRMQEMLENRR